MYDSIGKPLESNQKVASSMLEVGILSLYPWKKTIKHHAVYPLLWLSSSTTDLRTELKRDVLSPVIDGEEDISLVVGWFIPRRKR